MKPLALAAAAVTVATLGFGIPTPAQSQATATPDTQTQQSAAKDQPAGIVVFSTLSNAQKSRKIGSNDFHPNALQPSIRTGNFADPVNFQFVVCEPGKNTLTDMTLDSTASTIVKAANRNDTEIVSTVNFPLLPSGWIEKQNNYAGGGGCGYFQEPKIVVLNVKGTVPFKHLDPQYTFTSDKDGYTLKMEVKPLSK